MEEVTFLDLVNKYVGGEMSPSEKLEFETYLSNNMTAQKRMADHIELVKGIRAAAREELRTELKKIKEQMESPLEVTDSLSSASDDQIQPFSLKRWVPYIAAVFFLGMIAYFNLERDQQAEYSDSVVFEENGYDEELAPIEPENEKTGPIADQAEPIESKVAKKSLDSQTTINGIESVVQVRILPKAGMVGSPTAEPFFIQVYEGRNNEFHIAEDTLILYMDLKKEGLLYENKTRFTILSNGILEVNKDSINLRFIQKRE